MYTSETWTLQNQSRTQIAAKAKYFRKITGKTKWEDARNADIR